MYVDLSGKINMHYYIRKTCVYFLKEKSQDLGGYKDHLAMVEVETSRKLKVM